MSINHGEEEVMPERGTRRLDRSVKASATGVTKEDAQLAVALKILRAADKKEKVVSNSQFANNGRVPVVHFLKTENLRFRPALLPSVPPDGTLAMGWKCDYEGNVEVTSEPLMDEAELEGGPRGRRTRRK